MNGLDGVATDMVLILDDYHVIAAPPIHQGLAFLVQHLPPRLHLVLATRADPLLPLARLRAQGAVTEVRATDLRFTPEEAAAFLTETWNHTYVQRAQGALHLAVATCRQALTWSAAQGAGPSPIAGVLHLSLVELLREWNDLDAAQCHLTDGIALCAQWGHVDLQLFGPLFQARLLAAWGDLDGALAVLHGAKGDAQHSTRSPCP